MDQVAQRYGVRPSELAGIGGDEVLAFQFDVAVMLTGMQHDKERHDEARRKKGEDSSKLPEAVMAKVREKHLKDHPGKTAGSSAISFSLN